MGDTERPLILPGDFSGSNSPCTEPSPAAASASPPLPEPCPQLRLPPPAPGQMSPGADGADPEVPRMDPRILIFLLYVMILHELVSGWMEYQKQMAKPKKQAGPVWSSR